MKRNLVIIMLVVFCMAFVSCSKKEEPKKEEAKQEEVKKDYNVGAFFSVTGKFASLLGEPERNTAEMMVQCMLESPYRNEELLKALEGHSKVILQGEPEKSHATGDYAAYIIKMFGPYLHWEGYEESIPRTRFSQGVQSSWRVVIGPFGRCANLIKKRPEELFMHKDWSYEKYGLCARNTAHENRKVIDVVAASADGWARSTDDQGQVEIKRTFTLGKEKLQNAYLKIKWSGGDIEILLNGVLVKKKLGGLADFGAVHIPDDARKTLKEGANTLVVRTVGKADELSVNAGIIDWK